MQRQWILGFCGLWLVSCSEPHQEEPWHHECPAEAPEPPECGEVWPAGFDPAAMCLNTTGGAVDSLWSGRMCAADGCDVEGYPPLQADFVGWYLCDGVPVELWCVTKE